jgi:D-serine deaminase-like pyridoxal phosphate-dependent protein
VGQTLADIPTPAAIVDLDRMAANLDRMAGYAKEHGLALRPHTKTHKTPELAAEQLRRGASGVTVATVHEAEVMSGTVRDILIAYPPVGEFRMRRIVALPGDVQITVAIDSDDALRAVQRVAAERPLGVLVELDLGMHRVGVQTPEDAVRLARAAADSPGVTFRGVLFYPGHIRQQVNEQDEALSRLSADLALFLDALKGAGLPAQVVSGGSTPAGFASHRVAGLTEMRPGTYIFNDRTTAEIGACAWTDCAYTVLATVISVAVPGQAVVDAGSKALSSDQLRAAAGGGFGVLLDHSEVMVQRMSEEHGVLDLSGTAWRPRVGDRVRIVPNHVCVSVNLHDRLYGTRHDTIETIWPIAARNWAG